MISFEGKAILAPMVRISTLPMRALCLEYGADIVFSPEIIDKKIISTRRIQNILLGTIDYVDPHNRLVFRTHPSERERLIFQIGTADNDLALQAALKVSQDIAGVDVNCGCPKHFSVHAGMGAALLYNPQKLTCLLKHLVENSGLPISAKIRLLPNYEDCIYLIQQLLTTGIHALTVHCRTPEQRPKDTAQHQILLQIISKLEPTIPIIINGDLWTRIQAEKVVQKIGANGFMFARAAQWNASCFKSSYSTNTTDDNDTFDSLKNVTKKYLINAIKYGNSFSNTKYTVVQMWNGEQLRHQQLRTLEPNKYGPCSELEKPSRLLMCLLQRSKSVLELCDIFKVDTFGYQEDSLKGSSDEETPITHNNDLISSNSIAV